MDYLKIHDWDVWQSYRVDRGQPPWIKIHRALLRDIKWVYLTDAQKGHLISMWMLAADKDGQIPYDATVIRKLCGLDSDPDLELFISKGLVDRDVTLTPTRRQPDVNLTAQSRVEESRVEESREEKKSGKPSGGELPKLKKDFKKEAQEALEYLNRITGKAYTRTSNIEACFKRENCTVADCRRVIDFKWNEWKGKDLERNVNPTTLWRAVHFADYLDQAGAGSNVPGWVDRRPRDDWGNIKSELDLRIERDVERDFAKGDSDV